MKIIYKFWTRVLETYIDNKNLIYKGWIILNSSYKNKIKYLNIYCK